MQPRKPVSFRVFLTVEILCGLLLVLGLMATASPLWTPGGVLGWWEGYQPQRDVLGIAWLAGSTLSVLLGLLVAAAAAVLGISVGIAAGIVGLARNRKTEVDGCDRPT